MPNEGASARGLGRGGDAAPALPRPRRVRSSERRAYSGFCLAAGLCACSSLPAAAAPSMTPDTVRGQLERRHPIVARSRDEGAARAAAVAAGVGGVLAGAGAVSAVVGWPACRNSPEFSSGIEQASYCTGLVLPLALGTGVVIWASREYERAKRTSGAPARARPALGQLARPASHPFHRPDPE